MPIFEETNIREDLSYYCFMPPDSPDPPHLPPFTTFISFSGAGAGGAEGLSPRLRA